MSRIERENRFIRAYFRLVFCPRAGIRCANNYNDVGAYQVNANMLGFIIELIENEAGGITHPFGYCERREFPEMYLFMRNAIGHV